MSVMNAGTAELIPVFQTAQGKNAGTTVADNLAVSANQVAPVPIPFVLKPEAGQVRAMTALLPAN